MPTHWESSKRPLFVRTVFVNGSRHAILSQEDPLCQSNAAPSSRKQSRPSSCQSFASTFSVNSFGSQDSNLGKRFRNVKTDGNNNNQWDQTENKVNNGGGGSGGSKGDISSELQGCLVKLRLVLATHENKNKVKNERLVNGSQNGEKKSNQNGRQKENVKQKRKKSNHPKTNKKKSCDYYYHDSRGGALKEIDLKGYKEENNNYYSFNNENEDRNYYYLETTSKLSSSSSFNYCCEKDANLIEIRDICCFEGYHEARKENESILSRTSTTITSFVEKVERNHGNPPSQFFPTIQLPSNDISWNSLSSDSYFTRPFYNPLSERVLQWLDLASKRKENHAKLEKLHEEIPPPSDNVERIFEGNTFLDENNIARYRDKTKSKKNKMLRSKSEGKTCKNTNYERKDKKREFIRQSTEKRSDSKESDAEDEVRQENDVETALSNQIIQPEYPKFSKELNKLHKSISQQDKCEESSGTFSEIEKISTATDSTSSGIVISDKVDSESSASSAINIPEKARNESTVSLNLQESIMNSFNDVVTLKAAHKNDLEKNKPEQSTYSFTTYQYFPQAKPKTYQTTEERRGQLTRQAKLQESSDEDEDASLKARKIDCWNKGSVSVKQRRNAFSHRNSMFNKTIDCNSSRARREVLKRQKNRTPSLQQRDKDDEDSCPSENQSIIQAIFHSNPLPPQLQNKIPWLRDYQTGGKNMWPSEKGTNKPQLHIFMPAIPPKISEGGTGDESISDVESLTSEVCPCNEDWQVPEEA